MSNRLKFTNIREFTEQVKRAVNRQAVPLVLSRAAERSIPLIKQYVKESFKRTDVARLLLSMGGEGETKDLTAILGLEGSMATLAYQSIIDSIDDALEVEFKGVNYSGNTFDIGNKSNTNVQKIGFLIRVPKLREAVLSGNFTEYLSTSTFDYSTHIIPFMKWLIEGAYIDDVELSYKFYDSPPSRTGRALMIDGNGWSLEPEDFSSTGKNFLYDIINDSEMKENILSELERNIIQEFTSIQLTIFGGGV